VLDEATIEGTSAEFSKIGRGELITPSIMRIDKSLVPYSIFWIIWMETNIQEAFFDEQGFPTISARKGDVNLGESG